MPYPRQLTLRRRRLRQTYWFRLRRLRGHKNPIDSQGTATTIANATASAAR